MAVGEWCYGLGGKDVGWEQAGRETNGEESAAWQVWRIYVGGTGKGREDKY